MIEWVSEVMEGVASEWWAKKGVISQHRKGLSWDHSRIALEVFLHSSCSAEAVYQR